jgi:diguanylate cyclase (GGDEF)-like protein
MGTTKKEVRARFENLRRKIKETPATRLKDKTPLFVTTSIGICSERGESLERMMKIADECLYRAKGRGRNRLEA